MDLIEQAIFTSAETDRATGYQVVAASPGVGEADLRELATWGPSHDALLVASQSAMSVNFHPLPSGAFCVSRTVPAGWEYSGRGGLRVYTQCLVVPPRILARFANNPFALLRAAIANGALRLYDEPPRQLEPIRLAGRAAVVDCDLLRRLCTNPGSEWMATLVQAALDSVSMAIAGGPPPEQLVAGLINCLPPECRTEFSFSTGLKFSSRRPFRIVALSGDCEEQCRVERLYNLVVLQFGGDPPAEFTPIETWPRFIHRVLKSERTSFLATHLARRPPDFSPEDLPVLGLQFLEELDATSWESDASEEATTASSAAEESILPEELPEGLPESLAESPQRLSEVPEQEGPSRDDATAWQGHQAHAHHHSRSADAAAAVIKALVSPPSKQIETAAPPVLEKLEQLDDLVFEAIAGKDEALEELKALWPQLRHDLDDTLLLESREQYLRYALSIWEKSSDAEDQRNPLRAIQSLGVLCVLFDD